MGGFLVLKSLTVSGFSHFVEAVFGFQAEFGQFFGLNIMETREHNPKLTGNMRTLRVPYTTLNTHANIHTNTFPLQLLVVYYIYLLHPVSYLITYTYDSCLLHRLDVANRCSKFNALKLLHVSCYIYLPFPI